MNEAVRIAIEAADLDALRSVVTRDPTLAEADVHTGEGGKNVFPPLHLVCDAVFRRLATQEQALAMAEVLLEAGVDPERVYAKSGDTYLITAASLGVEDVGLCLVQRGVDVTGRGLFRATALHWAALMGLDRLALALAEAGADVELRDEQYACTPLEWALYAWTRGTNGDRAGVPRAARVLVERGARVPADALASLATDSDALMRWALSAGR